MLPAGPMYFDAAQRSDQSRAVHLAELVREQVLARTREEVPHAVEVEVSEISQPREDLIRIEAVVLSETESQKGILIGAGGRMIKSIGIAARRNIERELGLQGPPRAVGLGPSPLARRRARARPARDRVVTQLSSARRHRPRSSEKNRRRTSSPAPAISRLAPVAIRIGSHRFFSNAEPPKYPSAELNSAQIDRRERVGGQELPFPRHVERAGDVGGGGPATRNEAGDDDDPGTVLLDLGSRPAQPALVLVGAEQPVGEPAQIRCAPASRRSCRPGSRRPRPPWRPGRC